MKYALVLVNGQQNQQLAQIGFATTGILRNYSSDLFDTPEEAKTYADKVIKPQFKSQSDEVVNRILKEGTLEAQEQLKQLRDSNESFNTISFLVVPVESVGEIKHRLVFSDDEIVQNQSTEAPEATEETATDLAPEK